MATALEVQALVTIPLIAEAVAPQLPGGVALVRVNPSDEVAGLFRLDDEGAISEGAGVDCSSALNSLGDTCLLLQTSGTTSKPKTVPVTLHRLMLGAAVWAEAWAERRDELFLALNTFPCLTTILLPPSP